MGLQHHRASDFFAYLRSYEFRWSCSVRLSSSVFCAQGGVLFCGDEQPLTACAGTSATSTVSFLPSIQIAPKQAS